MGHILWPKFLAIKVSSTRFARVTFALGPRCYYLLSYEDK